MPTRSRQQANRARRRGRRTMAAALALWLGGVAMLWPDPVARVIHPARFATTGRALLPVDAYVAAARARLRPGERIGQLDLPAGSGPVIVTAGAARVWLDPPTARALDVATTTDGGEASLVHPAQRVGAVTARARAIVPGRVRRVRWPGPGRPDWLVTVVHGGRETVLKVADDTDRAGAAVARTGPLLGMAPIAAARWTWVLLLPAVMAWAIGRRRGPRR